ncbi:uncharacterized protein LOC135156342 [Lytechinus pictus]|uniref:uncharacterized protein LOC135156342 n=1 Tax=Lytechinus pictus TaxID=7653 RepID=UPI0030B9E43C
MEEAVNLPLPSDGELEGSAGEEDNPILSLGQVDLGTSAPDQCEGVGPAPSQVMGAGEPVTASPAIGDIAGAQAAPHKGGVSRTPPGFEDIGRFNRSFPEKQMRCLEALEWLVQGQLLPYPGAIVRMVQSGLPWDLVLGFVDRAYARAVEMADAGWVRCLHEYLGGRLSPDQYGNRFPLLDEGGGNDGLVFFDPDTPWWEPAMERQRRFPRGLAYLPHFEGRVSTATASAPWFQDEPVPEASTATCNLEQVGLSPEPAPTAPEAASDPEEEDIDTGPQAAASEAPPSDNPEVPSEHTKVPEAQAEEPSTGGRSIMREKGEAGRRGRAGAPASPGKRALSGAIGGPAHKRKARGPCPLCQQRPHQKLKVHVYRHMPPALRLGLDRPVGEELPLLEVMGCLRFLAQCFTGSPDLDSLVKFVNLKAPDNWNWYIPPSMEEEMFRFLGQLGAFRPSSISVRPLNSVAALLHWRVLAFLVGQLTEEEIRQLHHLGGSSAPEKGEAMPVRTAQLKPAGSTVPSTPVVRPKRPTSSGHDRDYVPAHSAPAAAGAPPAAKGGVSATPVAPKGSVQTRVWKRTPGSTPEAGRVSFAEVAAKPPIPLAVDSHFHLDFLEGRLGQKGWKCAESTAGREPRVPVRLVGGVANFCDPRKYKGILFPEGRNWKVSVGVLPRMASSFEEADLDAMGRLACDPKTSALGEIGLDYSLPPSTWSKQLLVYTTILEQVGATGKVLILHLRGEDGKTSDVPSRIVREATRTRANRHQRVHIHCCTLGPLEVEAWGKTFPNTYFSFGCKVKHFTGEQLDALRKVPLSKLLLETDSPYLPVGGVRCMTPAYIGEVGEFVASARRMGFLTLMERARINHLALYGV